MSHHYTVQATPQAQDAGAVALAIASLPESFGHAAQDTPAHVTVLVGTPGWTAEAEAAVKAGACGVVVVNPAPENTTDLAKAAEDVGCAVVLDQRWAANPALPAAQETFQTTSDRAVLLDSVATAPAGSDPEALLADHLAAVSLIAGPLQSMRVLRIGSHGYAVAAKLANRTPAALQGILTDARQAGLAATMLTDDGGTTVIVPEPLAAWPATVKVTGPHGETLLPTHYESAHRATWRRLKDHLDAGTNPADLARFAGLAESLAHLA